MSEAATQDPTYTRLLKAALECFLADEYHKVTTRMIADKAEANISMIRYYFGNKEGLYEEMIRNTMKPILDILDSHTMSDVSGVTEYLRFYYDTMRKHPEFPKLMLKVLALNQGPGRRFILQLLERGRTGGARRLDELKAAGQVNQPGLPRRPGPREQVLDDLHPAGQGGPDYFLPGRPPF